jgi:glycopeptide antibiotics resistance protein
MIHDALKSVIEISWPTLVIVLSIVIILRISYVGKSEKKFVLHKELFDLLFLAYVLVLFQLVTNQDIPGGGTNLMPFREILRYDFGTTEFYKQVLGNILLFVPLGYYATKYCKLNGLFGITIITLLCSGIIETVQHFIGRSFDIDDIILNLIGGLLGFLLYIAIKAIGKHMPEIFRKDWIKNIFAIVVVLAIGIYIYNLF